jgi:hypothetical protein
LGVQSSGYCVTNWMTGLAELRAAATAAEPGWHRIAWLAVDNAHGRNSIAVSPCSHFRLIKLRSVGADVEVCRWVLAFDNGSIQDLSVHRLLSGAESRPMSISARRLIGAVVDYDARQSGRRGRIEIWGQP